MDFEVVVTGVAGFIGSHQAEYLLEKGYSVIGIDNFHPYYSEKIKRNNLNQVRETARRSEANFEFVDGSILNSDDLDKLPKDPKWVFHLAALAGTRSSLEDSSEYSKINVYGTSKVLEYFDQVEKIIFISSSSVYGELSAEKLPVTEKDECSPKTPYSLSKHNAEKVVELYSDLQDFDYTIVRPFTVFGPRQRPDEVFTKFISNILDGKSVEIYGDGTQSRDFTYVKDAVQGIFLAAKRGKGDYNIGSQRRVTVNQIVEALDQSMDKKVQTDYIEEHPGDVSHTHADISKAENELGYNPETGIEEGLENCIEWVKQESIRSILSTTDFEKEKNQDNITKVSN